MSRLRAHTAALFVPAAAGRHAGRVGPCSKSGWFLGVGVVLFGTALGMVAPGSALAADKYGGVEIGAKGVKVSAVEVDASTPTPSLKVLKLDKKTEDVTISRLKEKNFAKEKIEDVADVVEEFVKALKEKLGVPDEHILVVASSGVPFADNFADLVAAVRKRTGKDVEKLDAKEEATLAALALVPKELRTQVLFIDIGSGNTKGGAFLDDTGTPERFVSLDVPFGTTTLARAIEEKAAKSGSSRADVTLGVSQALVGAPLRKKLEENPELGQRSAVLFAGGSVWAFVTMMKPETALEPFPKVTAADITAYVERINQAAGQYPMVDFARVTNAEAREAAQADYDRICGRLASKAPAIFKPEELQAGAALLLQVSDALAFSKKTVCFDRKAVTAWITARITPEPYRHLLPLALGRKLQLPAPTLGVSTAPAGSKLAQPAAPASHRVDDAVAARAYGEGYELYWSGQYSEARAAFQRALDFSEGDARFWFYKGLCDLALRDSKSADSSFSEGARLQSRNMPDPRTVGVALVRVQGPVRRYVNAVTARVEDAEGLHQGH